MATPYSVVFITVPDKKVADVLSEKFLELKLAACVNQIPNVRSMYWWEGSIKRSEEILLVVKTRAALMPELTQCVRENHPYATPEVVAFAVDEGLKSYLDWIGANTLYSKP